MEKIIVQGYKALGLQYFFTAGPDEVKAWIIQKGTKAPQAAGRIHGDFEKGSGFDSLFLIHNFQTPKLTRGPLFSYSYGEGGGPFILLSFLV